MNKGDSQLPPISPEPERFEEDLGHSKRLEASVNVLQSL